MVSHNESMLAVAEYVQALVSAGNRTRRVEDRLVYESYMADVAELLAELATGSPSASLRPLVLRHSRLRDQSWLVDNDDQEPAIAWERVRGLLGP